MNSDLKCLLLAPLRYPFISSIIRGLRANGIDVNPVDYEAFFTGWTNRLVNNYSALPRRVRNLWERPYVRRINHHYRRLFEQYRPDVVFIYNNQLVLPQLLEHIKKKARIVFMLGDNPLYTPTNPYNLHILFYADYVISPDSRWRDQLSVLGIQNVVFDCFGFNSEVYYPMEPGPEQRDRYRSDFVYVGSASKTNWGYKRAYFLSQFRRFDLRAYISGEGMERWLDFFPGLREKMVPHDRFDAGFNNLVYNCSRIAPVELVPSLFNGIHVRVFDILGAGILPLCEYSADLATVFDGIDLPLITDYRAIPELAAHWLGGEEARAACVRRMRERVLERYTPAMVIGRMCERMLG